MDLDEWCVLAHVDIGMRAGLEFAEDALRDMATAADPAAGVLDLIALKDEKRANHFEVVGRFGSEAAYHAHQVAPSNLAFRRLVGPVLGSPYEDRLHAPRGQQEWPTTTIGGFVVITQVEARPDQLDAAIERFDVLVAEQAAADGFLGQVVLQRRYLANNLEAMSVWTAPEAFDAHLGSGSPTSTFDALEEMLVAPIENRRFHLLAGALASH